MIIRETERLRLTALNEAALEAWIERDAELLHTRTGVRFEEPVELPPLFEEDLPMFRERMRERPDDRGWWVWLVSDLDDGTAVGVCGLSGPPIDGSTTLGYSVYPALEGNGYATEASGALIRWVFEHPGAHCVRVTAPAWNHASLAVARKLGMHEVDRQTDPEVGELVVLEVERE